MNRIKMLIMLSALAFLAALFISWNTQKKPKVFSGTMEKRNPVITFCGSGLLTDTSLVPARIVPGLGHHHFKITTTSPEAQAFFDQGLRLMYGYNQWEALRSFREAARLDPGAGMPFWGIAFALGPYINDPNPKDREKTAFEAIRKAQVRSARLPAIEKDLIDALAARFNGKTYDNRDSLKQAYYSAMAAVAGKYPLDPDVQTLFADAVMSTVPWQWWDLKGNPKPQTLVARPVLEGVLKNFPDHPGANHLYIHLMEESPTPEVANPSAKFLETALPAAGHLVHMPGHIYQRTGEYQKSIVTNLRAVAVDEAYLAESLTEDYGFYRAGYHPHNIDFICYSSYMTGQSELGVKNASKLVYRAGPLQTMLPPLFDFILTEPMTAYVRFGKWNEVLTQSLPGNNHIGAMVMFRFARGLAFIRKGYINEARKEYAQLDSLKKLDTLKSIAYFNSFSHLANIASHTLRGSILMHERKYDLGSMELRMAAASEDTLMYNEPPDWRIPVRHFLGAALLEAGRYAEAEQVYVEDLQRNRNNGWALQGLLQCQEKLGKRSEAASTRKRFENAWKNADIKISSSAF